MTNGDDFATAPTPFEASGQRGDWSLTEARRLQEQLRTQLCLHDALSTEVKRVAGVDVGYEEHGQIARAAVAVVAVPSLAAVAHGVARLAVTFPYVPGFLAFREIPAILAALEQLPEPPDLILCDGQGYAHPRRMGIACHLGLVTGLPTIGVGKTRLIGRHGAVPEGRGEWTPLLDHDEIVGAVLRTRVRVAPLFISAGHRVSLATALYWTLATLTRYRLPEPIRSAHRMASIDRLPPASATG